MSPRKDGCRPDAGETPHHVHGGEVAAGAAKLVVRHHVRYDACVSGPRSVGAELDPHVPDEQLLVAVGVHHDLEPNEVEDGEPDDQRTAPAPRRVEVVGELADQRWHGDRENGADAHHGPKGGPKNVRVDEVA